MRASELSHEALAMEAARIMDRLDELDRIIAGKGVADARPEATAKVMRVAHRFREAAGPGYEVKASPPPRAAGAVVRAVDLETARNDARTNTLLRALGSMSGE